MSLPNVFTDKTICKIIDRLTKEDLFVVILIVYVD